MGTLDQPTGEVAIVKTFAKVVNIHALTRPETKALLDEKMSKGWRLVAIYLEDSKARAVMVRTVDD